jgi:hypothetical protein
LCTTLQAEAKDDCYEQASQRALTLGSEFQVQPCTRGR